jgi:hypothetical protein
MLFPVSGPESPGGKVKTGMRKFAVAISILMGTGAFAQSASEVVGTWVFVSSVRDSAGGKINTYGAGAEGRMTLDGGGHYSITIIGANLPKFASGALFRGTAEENAAVLGRSNAHFGTYSVNMADKTLTFRTERGTFPNGDGTEQKRAFTQIGDELKYVIPLTNGGTSVVTWRRAQ